MRLSPGLWAALALGLILRGAYAWHGHSRGFIPTPSDGYETIALNLLERGEYAIEPGRPTSLREPGYPLLIAAVYGAARGRRAWLVLALQVAMGLASALMVLSLGRHLFSEADARLAFVIPEGQGRDDRTRCGLRPVMPAVKDAPNGSCWTR